MADAGISTERRSDAERARSGGPLDLAAVDAGGADLQLPGGAAGHRANRLQVDVPAAPGHVARVADAISETRPAPADITDFSDGGNSSRYDANLQFSSREAGGANGV